MATANRDTINRERNVEQGQIETLLAGTRTLREQAENAHMNTVDARLRAAILDLIDNLDDQYGAINAEYEEIYGKAGEAA